MVRASLREFAGPRERAPRRGRARWLLVAAAAVGIVFAFDAPRQLALLAWNELTGRPPLRVTIVP